MPEPLVSRFFKEKEALHCLLLPVGDMFWLIPSVMGAEVLARSGEGRFYQWRGLDLPLIAGSDLVNRPVDRASYERIIVLQSIQTESKTPFWGLLLNDLPKMVSLTHRDLSLLPEISLPRYMQMAVRVLDHEKTIYVPNFSELEQAVAVM